jgi:hypothetical protein
LTVRGERALEAVDMEMRFFSGKARVSTWKVAGMIVVAETSESAEKQKQILRCAQDDNATS